MSDLADAMGAGTHQAAPSYQNPYTFENAFRYGMDEKTGVFIDGSNLYAMARALNMNLDYKLLQEYLASCTHLVYCGYYTALYADENGRIVLQPLVDYLSYNNWSVVTKEAREYQREGMSNRIKGNMDVELVMDCVQIAPHLDHIMLFSGDGDFVRLVDYLQKLGKRVTVVGSVEPQVSVVSPALRKAATHFVDLVTAPANLSRDRETV